MTSNLEFLQVHIDQFAEKEKITNVKTKISIGNMDVSNFLGNIYRVQLEGEKINENKSATYKLIIKCSPKGKAVIFDEFKIRNFYLHEICFYEEKLEIFGKLLSGYDMNLKIDDIPGYFGSSTTKGDEVIC